ncbi:transporter substrate-binding domain-containing protein [Hoyosella rhizosphaerae]|uniref:Amino acid ABC transporter, substrate-binding protein n=1 Tax=Hoyosella rhizosphaerae TaxID=1755582 RepID=A0A916XJ95_9ACTN|nr:transporter substrate-binding domain-containing protein [Hoyosella rhizosphaerae]MBN4925330.1 transporter substrate-binding domain-containing protein [Hoyosella rhizosphaerae]GGC76166.1 putative amino acid ABC transporter, substrate-binding protein [Hoyosella rhizosphaerae]
MSVRHSTNWVRATLIACLVLVVGVAAFATSCSQSRNTPGTATPTELFVVNTSPEQQRIRAEVVRAIADRVPDDMRKAGTLTVATTGNVPPLSFRADDAMTMIGVEPDLAQLIADVLDLNLELVTTGWHDLFEGVEEGRFDVGFGNIVATANRMQRFDMVTYQEENQAFAVLANSSINSITRPRDISGLKIGVGAGTRSEEILQTWNSELEKEGLVTAELLNFVDGWEYYSAMERGEIDASFGPMSILNFESVTKGLTKVAGQVPGDGDRPALVSAITSKGSDVSRLVFDAINTVIMTGKYQAVFERWALEHATLTRARLNPALGD